MARFETAAEIINAAASECGLTAVADPYASVDPAFIQLRNILTAAGQEMNGMHEWQKLIKQHDIDTGAVPVADGHYELPTDFSWMIDQTGWTPENAGLGLPLGGPLSAQNWTYLVAGSLGPSTIFVSFRQAQGQLWFLPYPAPANIHITFEYISRNWATNAAGTVPTDKPTASDDIVLYEPILIKKFLKLRYREAKGFDTTAALGQFLVVFDQWTGKDASAPVLNAARSRVYPYLGYRNIPETGYGA
jgi:hypothetical protein